jgi:hypothetical protein
VPGTARRCLYVIGMHRSGTSAVTGLLAGLGLHGPSDEDLIPASKWNERGNNESASLTQFNKQLLRKIGGSWAAPPVLADGWDTEPALDDERLRAAPLVKATFTRPPFVWKDPRNCLLLPFWRSVIDPPDAAIFVYRHPVEVAESIRARNGFTLTHGLALWERYVRSAASNLSRMPTLLVRFDRVLEEHAAWRRELMDFTHTIGIQTEPDSFDRATEGLDEQLRHQRSAPLPAEGLNRTQHQIMEQLDQLQGAHLSWCAPDLGEEPGWVEDVLTIRRSFETIRLEQRRASERWGRARRWINGLERRSKPIK